MGMSALFRNHHPRGTCLLSAAGWLVMSASLRCGSGLIQGWVITEHYQARSMLSASSDKPRGSIEYRCKFRIVCRCLMSCVAFVTDRPPGAGRPSPLTAGAAERTFQASMAVISFAKCPLYEAMKHRMALRDISHRGEKLALEFVQGFGTVLKVNRMRRSYLLLRSLTREMLQACRSPISKVLLPHQARAALSLGFGTAPGLGHSPCQH